VKIFPKIRGKTKKNGTQPKATKFAKFLIANQPLAVTTANRNRNGNGSEMVREMGKRKRKLLYISLKVLNAMPNENLSFLAFIKFYNYKQMPQQFVFHFIKILYKESLLNEILFCILQKILLKWNIFSYFIKMLFKEILLKGNLCYITTDFKRRTIIPDPFQHIVVPFLALIKFNVETFNGCKCLAIN